MPSRTAEEADYFDGKGLKEYSTRNYSASLDYFDLAIAHDPNYIDAWVHKGDSLWALKDYNRSIECYLQALQRKNDSAKALPGLVEAYAAISDYEKAFQASARLTDIDPARKDHCSKKETSYRCRADIRMHRPGMIELWRLIIGTRMHYTARGLSLLAQGNSSDALEQFERIIALDPAYKLAYNARGLALQTMGRAEEAEEAYDEAQKVDAQWSQPRINQMHVLMSQSRPDEAMKIAVSF